MKTQQPRFDSARELTWNSRFIKKKTRFCDRKLSRFQKYVIVLFLQTFHAFSGILS